MEYHGIAATTDRLLDDGEDRFIFQKGCFHNMAGQTIPIYCDHKDLTDASVGEAYDLVEDEIGLKFKARFYSTAHALDVATKVEEGILNAVSIHFKASGIHELDNVRTCDRIRVLDIAIVVEATDPNAFIAPVKDGGRKTLSGLLEQLQHEIERGKAFYAAT